VLGWPKICKLVHVFLWEYSYKRLKLSQLLGQLGVSLTCWPSVMSDFPDSSENVFEITCEKGVRLSLVHPLLHTK
jgi:hypothetical protein